MSLLNTEFLGRTQHACSLQFSNHLCSLPLLLLTTPSVFYHSSESVSGEGSKPGSATCHLCVFRRVKGCHQAPAASSRKWECYRHFHAAVRTQEETIHQVPDAGCATSHFSLGPDFKPESGLRSWSLHVPDVASFLHSPFELPDNNRGQQHAWGPTELDTSSFTQSEFSRKTRP